MSRIPETDLILNADGSIYHLNLLPGDIADTVITVGDPDRVSEVSKYFDHIELRKSKREFTTHTGIISGKRITVLSTGIGTDNIDIVMNELDALANIDLSSRQQKKELRSLNVIRIGTSGAIQPDIPIDSLLVSGMAFGIDTLMHYYLQNLSETEQSLLTKFKAVLPQNASFSPYITSADTTLLQRLANDLSQGITISAPGFYAPQGREVRAKVTTPGLMAAIQNFTAGNKRISNLEMETAGIYGMSSVLGHRALSFNVILANRVTQQFSDRPQQIMDIYIRQILDRITSSK